MPGVFVNHWDSKSKNYDCILKPTPGGYPHTTIVYIPEKYSPPRDVLFDLGRIVIDALPSTVHIVDAFINSFYKESAGKNRHDVLLTLKEIPDIKRARTLLVATAKCDHKISDETISHWSFHPKPHITVFSSYIKAEAMECLAATQKELEKDGILHPIDIVGYNID